jgi:membrane-associated phospholipid phosphatase
MDVDVTRIVTQELGLVDRFDRNPHAALPSLHVGLPALYALWFARLPGAPRFISPVLWLWTAAMGWSIVYSGEHYVVDVAAGLGWAALVYFAMDRARLTHAQPAAEPVRLRTVGARVLEPEFETWRSA